MIEGCTEVTLMCIDEKQAVPTVSGEIQLPSPYRLLDVILDNKWLANAIMAQRNCEMQGEPFVIRLFDDDDLTQPPVFATAILTVPAQFTAFVTGGPN